MTRIIAIASGKGGTGKTTVAVNLAVAINDLGKNVILCDANFNTPHICIHLGVQTPELCINDVLLSRKSITKAVYLHPSGLKFIPCNSSYIFNDAEIINLPALFFELIGRCDILILDLAPSFTADKLLALKSADETIVVTNPELPALIEAKKVIKSAEELGSSVVGIIVNRIKKYGIALNEIKNRLNKSIIGTVPEDTNIVKALSLQHPVIYTAPRCPASLEFRKIAEMIGL